MDRCQHDLPFCSMSTAFSNNDCHVNVSIECVREVLPIDSIRLNVSAEFAWPFISFSCVVRVCGMWDSENGTGHFRKMVAFQCVRSHWNVLAFEFRTWCLACICNAMLGHIFGPDEFVIVTWMKCPMCAHTQIEYRVLWLCFRQCFLCLSMSNTMCGERAKERKWTVVLFVSHLNQCSDTLWVYEPTERLAVAHVPTKIWPTRVCVTRSTSLAGEQDEKSF